jgi:hypothetical protein
MLPINIPGPFDDYFALTGDLACVLLYQLASSHRKQLPAAGTAPVNPSRPI